MKEVLPSPDDEILEEHDMLEPQEPPHMNIPHKRKPCDIFHELERYGAPEGSRRKRKKPNPFPSYVALMCDLVDKEPTCFESIVQNKESVEAMTKEYQSIMKNDVWDYLLCLGFGLSLDETLFFGHCILVIYIDEVLLGFSILGFLE